MGFDHAGHRAVLQDFLQAIAQGRAPLASGRSAMAVQRLIDGIVRSSHAGTAIAL